MGVCCALPSNSSNPSKSIEFDHPWRKIDGSIQGTPSSALYCKAEIELKQKPIAQYEWMLQNRVQSDERETLCPAMKKKVQPLRGQTFFKHRASSILIS